MRSAPTRKERGNEPRLSVCRYIEWGVFVVTNKAGNARLHAFLSSDRQCSQLLRYGLDERLGMGIPSMKKRRCLMAACDSFIGAND